MLCDIIHLLLKVEDCQSVAVKDEKAVATLPGTLVSCQAAINLTPCCRQMRIYVQQNEDLDVSLSSVRYKSW